MRTKRFFSSTLGLVVLSMLVFPGYSNAPIVSIEYDMATGQMRKITASSLESTPLMEAIYARDTDKAKALIATGKNLDAINSEGKTAIMIAADLQMTEVVELLAKKRVPLNVIGEDGFSALMYSARWGDVETLKVLIDAGADVNLTGPDGLTALYAVTMGMEETPESVECIHLLAKAGAKMNVKDGEGTPLANAADSGRLHWMAALVAEGAEVNGTDSIGSTALHAAVWGWNEKSVRWLLAHGANLEARDQDGETPLFAMVAAGKARQLDDWATDSGQLEGVEEGESCSDFKEQETAITKYLLTVGAKVNIKNAKGESMIEVAKKRACPETVRMLQQAAGSSSSSQGHRSKRR